MLTKQVNTKIGSTIVWHALMVVLLQKLKRLISSSSAKQNTAALSNQLQSVKELLTKTSQELDREKGKVSWNMKAIQPYVPTGSVCSLLLASWNWQNEASVFWAAEVGTTLAVAAGSEQPETEEDWLQSQATCLLFLCGEIPSPSCRTEYQRTSSLWITYTYAQNSRQWQAT